MKQCPEKAPSKTDDPEFDIMRRWVNRPNAKHIKIHHIYGDNYRINVFTGVKTPDCVVESLTLKESWFVELKDGKVIDKTKGRVISNQQNIFK